MLWPKKNSYKEFDNEKKFLRLENSPPPPPPHNFSNGRSLTDSFSWRQEKLSDIVWTELETENKKFWKWNGLFLFDKSIIGRDGS